MNPGDKVIYTGKLSDGQSVELDAEVLKASLIDDHQYILDLKITLPGVDQYEIRESIPEGLAPGTWHAGPVGVEPTTTELTAPGSTN